MAENPKYEYLDRAGVLELAQGILKNVNERISERIVNTVNASSDDVHVPSALAVYKAITNSKHVTMATVTGDIDTIVPEADRKTDVIYLQRDDPADTSWLMYIWNVVTTDVDGVPTEVGNWICLGETKIDLANYWSKSDEDMAQLKEQLGINAINSALDNKVNNDQLDRLSQSQLQSILDEANHKTAVFTPTYTLTIKYLEAVTNKQIADPYVQANMLSGTAYSVPSPSIEGYSYGPSIATVSGTIMYSDVTVVVTYNPDVAEAEDEIDDD